MFSAYYLLEVIAHICSIIVFIIVVGYVFYVCIRYLRIEAAKRKLNKWCKELENDATEQMEDSKDSTSEA